MKTFQKFQIMKKDHFDVFTLRKTHFSIPLILRTNHFKYFALYHVSQISSAWFVQKCSSWFYWELKIGVNKLFLISWLYRIFDHLFVNVRNNSIDCKKAFSGRANLAKKISVSKWIRVHIYTIFSTMETHAVDCLVVHIRFASHWVYAASFAVWFTDKKYQFSVFNL